MKCKKVIEIGGAIILPMCYKIFHPSCEQHILWCEEGNKKFHKNAFFSFLFLREMTHNELCVRVSGPSVFSQSWFIRRREHFKTGADFCKSKP